MNVLKKAFRLRDCCQISLLIWSEFKQSITFYSPWNHKKTISFLKVLGVTEVNQFAWIHLTVKANLGEET